MKRLMMMVMMVCMVLGAGLTPADATLKAPLRGAALKTGLTPEQYQRAMHFMSFKSQFHQASSEDANTAIQKLETAHNIVQTVLNIASVLDSTRDMIGPTAGRLAKASQTLSIRCSPKISLQISKAGLGESKDLVLSLTGFFLESFSKEFPVLVSDSVFQAYLKGIADDDPEAIAASLGGLLEHSNMTIRWIANTTLSVTSKLLTAAPDLKGLTLEFRRAYYLSKWGNGFWKSLKAAQVASKSISRTGFILDVLGMVNDLSAASVLSNVSAATKTDLIALEFLDYYLVSYGGDLAAFQADMGLLTSNPSINQVFLVFMYQKDALGQTMKERYGPVDWLDAIFGNSFDADRAVGLIRRTLQNVGPLALRLNYTNNATKLEVGQNIGYKIQLEPLLSNEGTTLHHAIFSQSATKTATVYDGGTFIPIVPGSSEFTVNYQLTVNNAPFYGSFFFNDIATIDSSIVQGPSFKYSNLSVNGGLNEYTLNVTLGLSSLNIPYGGGSTGVAAGSLPITTNSTVKVRILYESAAYGLAASDWQIVPISLQQGATFRLPITDPGALAAKHGIVGSYRIQAEVAHPYVSDLLSSDNGWSLSYDNLISGGAAISATPYLEIQAPDDFLVEQLGFTDQGRQYMRLVSGKTLRLYPRNSSQWPNFNALAAPVTVWFLDQLHENWPIAAVLRTDGGLDVTIPNNLPQDRLYTILAIFSVVNGEKVVPGPFPIQQLTGIDSTTGGGDPPPSTTGSVVLPRTGQYRCYDTAGTEIPCAGTGQDGDTQAGMPWPNQRFTDNNDGSVTDNLTGLIWSKDANPMSSRDPNWGDFSYGMVTWQHALDYIAKLNSENFLGHNDWRMPNVNELASLFIPKLPSGHPFFAGSAYDDWNISFWSSSIYNSYALAFSLRNGVDVFIVNIDTKNYDGMIVWPVRSNNNLSSYPSLTPRTGQTVSYAAGDDGDLQKGSAWPVPRYSDNSSGIITDNLTGLMWTKDANLMKSRDPSWGGTVYNTLGYATWQQALDYIAKLNAENYLGYSDWRLPNIIELNSLKFVDENPFDQLQDIYWSSSQSGDVSKAMFLKISTIQINGLSKSSYAPRVWPVRGGYIDPNKIVPPVPTATFLSENLPDNSYQVGAATKSWRFKTGASAITGLKAVRVSADSGLGISQSEITIGDVAANTEFLVNLPINPVHDATDVKTSYWKLVDASNQAVTITNSSSGQFWLKLKTNRPPVFSQLQLQSVSGTTGQPLCLPLLATDPDNDALTYSVLSGGGSVVDGSCMGKTGKIYQNSSPTAGVTAVKLQISDSASATATKDIYTVVINENGAVKDFFNDLKYANASTEQLKEQYKAINYLAMNGIAIGVVDPNDPNGRIFELNSVTKQAEALGMIMKAAARLGRLELDAEERNLPNLIKIDTTAMTYQNFSWAAPYVLKAEELGMIDSAETFDPAAPVSRAWLAKMVYNLMELDPPTDALNPAAYIFSDAASFTSTEEYDAARAAAFFKYMGTLGSAFSPADSMIRADVAVVTARILQTPKIDGFSTIGLTDQTVFDRTLPATIHGNNFSVNGLTNLTGKTALMDSNGYVTEVTTVPAQTKLAVIRLGYGVTAENIMANTLAASPVTVATNPPDISSTEIRSLLLLIEDTVSGVRAISRKEYGVIFPDADGDGVRDNLDVWATNPLFSTDANNNGIPDNADSLWGLASRQGSEIITINGQQMTLIDAILNGLYDYPFVAVLDLPATSTTLTVAVNFFDAAGGTAPYSYCLATTNSSAGCSWNSTKPTSYTFGSAGAKTLYAFVKDATAKVSAARSATVTITLMQTLNVTVTNSNGGGGAVTIPTAGGNTDCTSGTCSNSFAKDSSVNLTATANAASNFGGWSGACSGTGGCTVVMSTDKSLGALFNLVPRARIGATAYGTLNSAYAVVGAGQVIEIKALSFVENLLLNRGLNITLRGGYADNYSGQTGYSELDGTLTISSGTIVLDRVVVK